MRSIIFFNHLLLVGCWWGYCLHSLHLWDRNRLHLLHSSSLSDCRSLDNVVASRGSNLLHLLHLVYLLHLVGCECGGLVSEGCCCGLGGGCCEGCWLGCSCSYIRSSGINRGNIDGIISNTTSIVDGVSVSRIEFNLGGSVALHLTNSWSTLCSCDKVCVNIANLNISWWHHVHSLGSEGAGDLLHCLVVAGGWAWAGLIDLYLMLTVFPDVPKLIFCFIFECK